MALDGTKLSVETSIPWTAGGCVRCAGTFICIYSSFMSRYCGPDNNRNQYLTELRVLTMSIRYTLPVDTLGQPTFAGRFWYTLDIRYIINCIEVDKKGGNDPAAWVEWGPWQQIITNYPHSVSRQWRGSGPANTSWLPTPAPDPTPTPPSGSKQEEGFTGRGLGLQFDILLGWLLWSTQKYSSKLYRYRQ